MHLQVEYFSRDELLRDAQTQFSKGGFLVRVNVPKPPELYSAASLDLCCPAGDARLSGRVVQVMPGLGVALAFDDKDPSLVHLLEQAGAQTFEGGPAKHSELSTSKTSVKRVPTRSVSGQEKAAAIHTARYGNKEERMRIMRGTDRSLHRFVIQNPGLGIDEVVAIAKSSTVGPESLQHIAKRREWAGRPEVAIALLRNTKCPVPVAIQMLSNIAPNELRQIAKTQSVRQPIVAAARKRLLGR